MSTPRTLLALHIAETSGPSVDLTTDLEWVAEAGRLEVVVPGPGAVADSFRGRARVTELGYSTPTVPRGPGDAARVAAGLVRDVGRFRAHLRATRPELVVVATTWLPTALLAARLERVPTIAYAAEMRPEETARRSLRSRRRALLWELTRRLATEVVACSASAAEPFTRRGTPAAVVYPPIADAFADGDRDGFRAARGIDSDAPCLAALGYLTRGRGQDVLVRALPSIQRALPTVRCALVGDPFPRRVDLAFRDELMGLADRIGVGDALALGGFPARVADAYAAADVVVNPVRDPESFGRVACEALAARTPVVSSRVGAVPEVLRDGETALLVPPDDPGRLAEAVVRVLEDRDLARRLAEAGRADVLERFAPERSREAFRQVVEDLMARHEPGIGGRGSERPS